MKFRLVGMSRKQTAVSGLGQVILSRSDIEVGEVTLGTVVTRREFDSRLQFSDGGVSLLFGSKHSPQLNVNRARIGIYRKQLPQIAFRIGKTAPPHVKVREPDNRVGRMGIERQRLLVFLLSIGKFILPVKKLARGDMRVSLSGLKSRRLLVSRKRFI